MLNQQKPQKCYKMNKRKPMELITTSNHFILQTILHKEKTQLVMNRQSGHCFTASFFGHNTSSPYSRRIYCLLGFFPISSVMHLLVVKEAELAGTIEGQEVYRIMDVELIPFEPLAEKPSEKQVSETVKLLKSGFYFSYFYDLTTRRAKAASRTGTLHDRATAEYYWNLSMYKELIQQSVDTQWMIPIVQGYIGINTVNMNGSALSLALISRRSWHKAGTRYNQRGVDHHGNTANYVETEQLLTVNSQVFSYVQIRGSVPVFWEQVGVSADLRSNESVELNRSGFLKHLANLQEEYRDITFVNLLSSTKAMEVKLTETWLSVVDQSIKYVHFDFHNKCRGNKYNKVNELLSKLDDVSYSFHSASSTQHSVIRTNCLDCLDRTNVVQYYFAWRSLSMQLGFVTNFQVPLERADEVPIGVVFKSLWYANGDILSHQYTGTASTISSVTKDGKHGLKDMLASGFRSIGRFYNANVEDKDKQKAIDTLLRKRDPKTLMDAIEERIERRVNEFARFSPISLRAVTWNLSGKELSPRTELMPLLLGNNNPDIVVVSLQEVVKLNALSVIQGSSNQKNLGKIRSRIEEALQNQFFLVSCEDMIGCALYVYARNELFNQISNAQSDKVKTGFKGNLGNKGAVAVRFCIQDTSIVIYNCHLASGKNLETRINQFQYIVKKAFKNKLFSEHDVHIMSGDLNFRIDMNAGDTRKSASLGNFDELLMSEELVNLKNVKIIRDFHEDKINFMPTYKYDVGTNNFDSSRKLRAPAWCDRILYKGKLISSKVYGSGFDYSDSDHKPVFADFQVSSKVIDHAKRREISEQIYASIQDFKVQEKPQQPQRAYEEQKNEDGAQSNPFSVDLLGLEVVEEPKMSTSQQEVNLLDL